MRLGHVYINGVDRRNMWKYERITGFVPQEDNMHRNLTVGENLQYAASLRVPWFREPHRMAREVLLKLQLYKYRYYTRTLSICITYLVPDYNLQHPKP